MSIATLLPVRSAIIEVFMKPTDEDLKKYEIIFMSGTIAQTKQIINMNT